MKHNRKYWTKEKCKEECLKFKTPKELKINNNYIYFKCYKNFWLDEFYPFFEIKRDVFWSKEKCKEEALKYSSRKEFSNNSRTAYTISLRKGWIDEVCSNMDKKPFFYWTKEKCKEEALKYKTRTEFKKYSYQAYKYSRRNIWFDDVCNHMPKVGNLYKRCIYAFEFSDMSVYVGLTYNIEKRTKSHYKNVNSQVNKHIKKIKEYPNLVKLCDYIDVDLAKLKEHEYIEYYRNKNWFILNKQKAGNIGYNKQKINLDFYSKEISKFKTLKEFRVKNSTMYKNIRRFNYDYLLENLHRENKPRGFYTKELCLEQSLKYKSRIDFFKKDPNVYNAAVRKKWINEICNHMKRLK